MRMLYSFIVIIFFHLPAWASYTFFYDDPIHCTHIHTQLTGSSPSLAWTATNITEEHLPFLTKMYENPNIMKHFGGGAVRDADFAKKRILAWTQHSNAGYPFGAWALKDNKTDDFLGYIEVHAHSIPGYGEIVGMSIPSLHGQGVGGTVIQTLVKHWAPLVTEMGHLNDGSILCEKFRCFGGKPLSHLYATSSPANVASWKLQLRIGFQPMPIPTENPIMIDCLHKSIQLDHELESYLMDTLKTTPGKLCSIIDHKGITHTASFHPVYGHVKYHLVYEVPEKIRSSL